MRIGAEQARHYSRRREGFWRGVLISLAASGSSCDLYAGTYREKSQTIEHKRVQIRREDHFHHRGHGNQKITEIRVKIIDMRNTAAKVSRVRRGAEINFYEGCEVCRFRFKLT